MWAGVKQVGGSTVTATGKKKNVGENFKKRKREKGETGTGMNACVCVCMKDM